jgi:hypothetical protein
MAVNCKIGRAVAIGIAASWLGSCGSSKGSPGPTAPNGVAGGATNETEAVATAAPAASAPAPAKPAAARADGPSRGVRMVRCEIRGTPAMPKDAVIWDAPQRGNGIASFAGQTIGLAAYEMPLLANGRARIRTLGGIEVEGWIAAADLPLSAGEQVPVVAGHVWIARGQKLAFAAVSADAPERVTVDAHLAGQVVQTIRVAAPCSTLTLDTPIRPGWDVPGTGRGYVPRHGQIDLFGEPGGAAIVSVHPRAPETSMLMWSTEVRAGFVHVLFHDDLIVDAWAREGDLVALKPGETMDLPAPTAGTTAAAHLAVSGTPALVRAAQDTQIRLTPENSSRPVGVVAPGTDLYVIDTVLGWSSVLPRALNLLPPAGRSFWVRAAEVTGAPGGTTPR